MKRKAILNLLIGAAMAVGLGAITAPPAQAAARDGFCEAGEFCYFYNTGLTGSVSDFTTSVANYGTNPATCYVFKTPGYAGYGACIKNNAAAVKNNSSVTVRIYYNSDYNVGYPNSPFLDIAPGVGLNLVGTPLYNNNASHKFGTAPTTPPPATGGLTNPYASAYGPNGGWSPRSAWLRDTIKSQFGLTCTTYATSDTTSEHSIGNAMDCFGDLATRRSLQSWAAANARRLEVYYVIHEQHIWSLPRSSEGWRLMADRGSVTANHYDHVHISMQNPRNEY